MFKIGDKVVCKVNHPTVDNMTRGRICTIIKIIPEERDDSGYLCSIKESVGYYSLKYFVPYNMYFRKDKIKKLKRKIKMNRILHPFSF